MQLTRRQLKKFIVEMMSPDIDMGGEKKKMFVLVGPPSVGKSTWIQSTFTTQPYIINRDDLVEQVAAEYGWTYDDMFAGPPADAVLGDVDPKFGEVIPPPSYMTWVSSVYSKVNEANGKVHSLFMDRVAGAVPSGQDIVVDMTNMNARARSSALNAIEGYRDEYEKIAVVFDFQGAEEAIKSVAGRRAQQALALGKSKTIPPAAFDRMFNAYEPVTMAEGFDAIVNVDNRDILRDLADQD